MQLIFKVVHFMTAVIMMQDPLSVATLDELHKGKRLKSVLYNAAGDLCLTHIST